MREIKFRGKRLHGGEWVYGGIAHWENQVYITKPEVNNDGRVDWFYEVDPSTVGQYTGLKDNDGKEIWEGDIVAHLDTEFICTVIYQKLTAMFLAEEIDCERMGFGIDKVNLVIGNIHENG